MISYILKKLYIEHMKSLKWLFIEQDVTYWNRSGRTMLYKSLSKL